MRIGNDKAAIHKGQRENKLLCMRDSNRFRELLFYLACNLIF